MIKLIMLWLALGMAGLVNYIRSQIKHNWQWNIGDVIYCMAILAGGLFSFIMVVIPHKILSRVIRKGNSLDGYEDFLEQFKKEEK